MIKPKMIKPKMNDQQKNDLVLNFRKCIRSAFDEQATKKFSKIDDPFTSQTHDLVQQLEQIVLEIKQQQRIYQLDRNIMKLYRNSLAIQCSSNTISKQEKCQKENKIKEQLKLIYSLQLDRIIDGQVSKVDTYQHERLHQIVFNDQFCQTIPIPFLKHIFESSITNHEITGQSMIPQN